MTKEKKNQKIELELEVDQGLTVSGNNYSVLIRVGGECVYHKVEHLDILDKLEANQKPEQPESGQDLCRCSCHHKNHKGIPCCDKAICSHCSPLPGLKEKEDWEERFKKKFTYFGHNQADQLEMQFKQYTSPEDIISFILEVQQQARRENMRVEGLSAVLRFIRNKARLDIMKADMYGQGYYQAIKDLEDYFGISEVDKHLSIAEKKEIKERRTE